MSERILFNAVINNIPPITAVCVDQTNSDFKAWAKILVIGALWHAISQVTDHLILF